MANRYMPTAEYRKKLRDRHILEWFCLVDAAVMIVLSLIFILNIDRGFWVPETVAILGGILNYALAIRAILTKNMILATILFLVGCGCFGLLVYLNYT